MASCHRQKAVRNEAKQRNRNSSVRKKTELAACAYHAAAAFAFAGLALSPGIFRSGVKCLFVHRCVSFRVYTEVPPSTLHRTTPAPD